MYKCKYCEKEFKSLGGCRGHEYGVHENIHTHNVICRFCKKEFKQMGLYSHEPNCPENPSSKAFLKLQTTSLKNEPQDGNCQYCNKYCRNQNSLRNHERLCKENPNGQQSGFVNYNKNYIKIYGAWNRGLTKTTDERVAAYSNKLIEYFKTHEGTFKGKKHTELAKQKIALAQLLVDHDARNKYSHGKRGYLDGMFFMSTWELAYYIYNRDKGHKIIRCPLKFDYEYEGKLHKYTPDFLVDDSVLVEVKGWETELDRLKYTLVDKLLIVYYEDIKVCIDYVKTTYKIVNIEDMYDIFISKD